MDAEKRLSRFINFYLSPHTLSDVKSYRRSGSSFDGCTLYIRLKDGLEIESTSYSHNWDVEVAAIEKHWEESKKLEETSAQ